MLILIWQMESICAVLKYIKEKWSIAQNVYKSLQINYLKIFYYDFMEVFKWQKSIPCINYLNNHFGIFYEVTQFLFFFFLRSLNFKITPRPILCENYGS